MKCSFIDESWDDYVYWSVTDKKILKRINDLIKDIKRNPFIGLGKPEPLKHEFKGCWSRRITDEHRLVYEIHDGELIIIKCRFHYD